MAERSVVHDLFPLGEKAVNAAFGMINREYNTEERAALRRSSEVGIVVRNRALLTEPVIFYDDWRDALGGGPLINKPGVPNPRKSYVDGLIVGHTAVQMEAYYRTNYSGIAPTIPKEILRTWSRDETQKAVDDIDSLGRVLTDFEGPGLMTMLETMNRTNRYDLGRVYSFVKSEPAIENALDTHFPGSVNDFDVMLIPFSKGLYDVCMIFRAFNDAQNLSELYRV
jgi:hypothetical protein